MWWTIWTPDNCNSVRRLRVEFQPACWGIQDGEGHSPRGFGRMNRRNTTRQLICQLINFGFRVLETADEYFPYYKKYHAYWRMYGLNLPDDILKKVYYQNALKIIPGLDASLFED